MAAVVDSLANRTRSVQPSLRLHLPKLGWHTLFFCTLSFVCPALIWAQTAWPAMQVEMYPYVETMLQTRPEQTVLLGEGEQQTGIFYASVAEAYSEEIHNALLEDAEEKDWRLLSVVRLGTSYVMTLTKNDRILDLRLTNTAQGVEVMYSVLMNQQPRRK